MVLLTLTFNIPWLYNNWLDKYVAQYSQHVMKTRVDSIYYSLIMAGLKMGCSVAIATENMRKVYPSNMIIML